VDEVGTSPGVPLQGIEKRSAWQEDFSACPTLVRFFLLAEHIAGSVVVIGSRLPPRRFYGLAVFRDSLSSAEAPDTSMDLAFPSRHTSLSPPESCAAPARPSWGLIPLQRVRQGGLLTRVSKPGLFHLQGFSPSWWFAPSAAFRPRGSVPLMGFWPSRALPLRRAVRLAAPEPSCCFRHRVLLL
jgi:hypothetical protein